MMCCPVCGQDFDNEAEGTELEGQDICDACWSFWEPGCETIAGLQTIINEYHTL